MFQVSWFYQLLKYYCFRTFTSINFRKRNWGKILTYKGKKGEVGSKRFQRRNMENKKTLKKILGGSKAVFHSYFTDSLFWKFQKILRKMCQVLRTENIDSVMVFLSVNFLENSKKLFLKAIKRSQFIKLKTINLWIPLLDVKASLTRLMSETVLKRFMFLKIPFLKKHLILNCALTYVDIFRNIERMTSSI